MNKIIEYLIRFLLYGNKEAVKQVGYTNQESDWNNYRVVIVPNGKLGKEIVLPDIDELKVEKVKLDGLFTRI